MLRRRSGPLELFALQSHTRKYPSNEKDIIKKKKKKTEYFFIIIYFTNSKNYFDYVRAFKIFVIFKGITNND